ncbi:MAG: hypothetical protein O3C63_08795 [Cyanobacteria bacterium]|nr:hypothetical protein [Cyanobacteriota bacterium]
MVDTEASGPAPGVGNMTHFGAVVVDRSLDQTFYGQLDDLDGSPNNERRVMIHQPQVESIGEPKEVMSDFKQ